MFEAVRKFFRQDDIAPQPAANKRKWPETTPIDKSDPYWEFNNNMNCNGVAYKKHEVEPGVWHWVEDEESNRRSAEHERRRADLFWALRTRVLTDGEMEEAKAHGKHLNVESMTPYREEEKSRELNDAWYQQARLRSLVEKSTTS